MSTLLLHKVSALPSVLEPSSAYFVNDPSTGALVIHITDVDGSIAYRTLNNQDILNTINQFLNTTLRVYTRERNPVFTWTDGRISRIDYSSGAYKLLTYNPNDTLNTTSAVNPFFTLTKTLHYNVNGSISHITETVS